MWVHHTFHFSIDAAKACIIQMIPDCGTFGYGECVNVPDRVRPDKLHPSFIRSLRNEFANSPHIEEDLELLVTLKHRWVKLGWNYQICQQSRSRKWREEGVQERGWIRKFFPITINIVIHILINLIKFLCDYFKLFTKTCSWNFFLNIR